MSTQPLVSVVIPSYNYGHFIGQAVESVLNQSYKNIEIIVVDDGSQDHTDQILAEFGNRITVIKSENQGACTARNLGILHSKGELIAFLDADDYWEPTKTEIQVKALISSRTDLNYCEMIIDDGSTHRKSLSPNPEELSTAWFHKNPGRTPFAPSVVLMRRELVARTSGWNTNLKSPAEDFDFFRRSIKYGKFSKVQEPLVVHRNHEASLTASNDLRYFQDNRRALRIMIAEDRDYLRLWDIMRIWWKFNLILIKHALRKRRIRLLLDFLLRGKGRLTR